MPPLPHWTEPPTGAVPAIFADDTDEPADELDAWATVTGAQPRFRAQGSDWAASDFAEDLSGEHQKLGALSNEGPVDEEADFARDLAARRRRPRTRAARAPTERRPERVRKPVTNGPDSDFAREGAPARDLPTAILTAAAVAVIAVVCFTQGRNWTVVLAALVVGVATLELAISLQKRGLRPATLVALVASTLMPIAAKNFGTAAYPVVFGLVVIVSLVWFLWEITPGRPLPGVASTVLVFAYVGGLGGFAGLLLESHNGVRLVLGVALCVIAYDVFGFFVGSQFGHTAVAPRISPNKTVEGTVAGMLASIIVGAAIVGNIKPWDGRQGVVARCARRGRRVHRGSVRVDAQAGSRAEGSRLPASRPRRSARPLRRVALLPADRLLPLAAVQDLLNTKARTSGARNVCRPTTEPPGPARRLDP